MGATQYGENQALTALLTGGYVALHTADPTVGNEVTGGAYARQAYGAFTLTGTNPASAKNNSLIEFPTASALWGTITHFSIWDQASGGNMRLTGTITDPKIIGSGDVVRWLANALTVTAD